MAQSLPELKLGELTVEQRLELIGILWDGIPESVDALAIPDSHREELERRIARADAHPEDGVPWEDVSISLHGGR
jgi:putative addiction module component (TIGR02574 family)